MTGAAAADDNVTQGMAAVFGDKQLASKASGGGLNTGTANEQKTYVRMTKAELMVEPLRVLGEAMGKDERAARAGDALSSFSLLSPSPLGLPPPPSPSPLPSCSSASASSSALSASAAERCDPRVVTADREFRALHSQRETRALGAFERARGLFF